MFEAPAFVAGFDDLAMMGQPVEKRGSHFGVAKDARPFGEGQVGGDDDRSALVEAADQMEEQLAAGLGEGQIAKFVQDHEVEAGEEVGHPPLAAGAGFAFQPVDEIDHIVEAPSGAAADAGPGNGDGKMALAGACSADQDGVSLLGQKAAVRQLAHQRLIDGRAGKLEAIEVLGQRQLGERHLVFDRSRLFFGDLGLQEIANNARRFVLTLDPGRHDLVEGGAHAVELQLTHQGENAGPFHGLILLKLS